MKFIGKKLASKRGETLVEILVAILIIAQKQDELFYEAVGTLEKMEESDNTTKSKGNLQYEGSDGTSKDVEVEYLTQDGLSVYHNGGTP